MLGVLALSPKFCCLIYMQTARQNTICSPLNGASQEERCDAHLLIDKESTGNSVLPRQPSDQKSCLWLLHAHCMKCFLILHLCFWHKLMQTIWDLWICSNSWGKISFWLFDVPMFCVELWLSHPFHVAVHSINEDNGQTIVANSDRI